MNVSATAAEWAADQAKTEAEAFEQAMSRIISPAKGELMNKRLTDRKVAEDLLHNSERLAAAGFDVPIDHKRYIKLARYEDEEERKEKALVNYDPDEWYE